MTICCTVSLLTSDSQSSHVNWVSSSPIEKRRAGKLVGLHVVEAHFVVIASGGGQQHLTVDRHQVCVPALMIDMPAHDVHAARRAGDQDGTIGPSVSAHT